MAGRSVDSRWSLLVCFCATFGQIVNMGIGSSFGVLFPAIMKEYKSSRQATSWIGSIAFSLVFFASPLAGSLSDRFGCRVITMMGSLICTTSLFLTSFATKFPHYYFTYSLLYGLGGCLVRVSAFLVTAKYFERRRALANGFVTAGAGLGLFVFGPLTQFLLDNVGLVNTYRVLAACCLAIGVAAISFHPLDGTSECHRQRDAEAHRSCNACDKCKVIDCSLWKHPAFTVCVVTFSFQVYCMSSLNQHLVKHCQEMGFPPDRAANLYMFIGLASFTSRIAAGYLLDASSRLNPLHVNQLASCLLGTVTILFGVGRRYSVLVALCMLYGLCEGALVSTGNLILLTVVESKRMAAAFGLSNAMISIWFVSAPPLAGLMADNLGSYEEVFYTSGGIAIFASCLPLVLCFLRAEPNEAHLSIEVNRQAKHELERETTVFETTV